MNAFDNYAPIYDDEFSSSSIGKLQRAAVHHYLTSFNVLKGRILEVGGGTGVDALFFAQFASSVYFTEPSKGMMDVAQSKFKNLPHISTEQIPAQNITHQLKHQNLIYSGFGALNCLSPQHLQDFFYKIDQLAAPHTNIVLVIMGRKCMWERLYFTFKGKLHEASRRQAKVQIMAQAGQGQVATWYYSPQDIRKGLSANFELVGLKPVGFLVPPSYLQTYFNKHPFALKWLGRIDKLLGHFPFLANYSDHFLIHLRKKTI